MSKALQRSNIKPQQTDGKPDGFDNVDGDHLASNDHHCVLSSKPCTHERSKAARTAFTSRIESESYAKTSLKELYRSVEVVTTPARPGHSRLGSTPQVPPPGTTLYEALLEIKRLEEENEALRMEVKRLGPLDTLNETLRAENATLRENNDAFQVKEEAYKHEVEKWQGRALRCKDQYRDYRAKVKRSILNNQLGALETPARGLSRSTPHWQADNESEEEGRGRAGRDLEHGLGYWESLQNSVRLKRSAIRPQTVSAADVTNAHVLGGTSALRKSKYPQPQFHIIDPSTPSKQARSRQASPTKTPARTARTTSPEKTPWRI